MIYSSMYADDDWGKYPKAIQLALAWIRDNDVASMEPGTIEIQGKDMYAMIQNPTQKKFADSRPEMHYDYLDLQYIIDGEEVMGVCPKKDNYELVEEKPSSDVYFTGPLENESFIILSPGDYIVLFPNDLHRPCVAKDENNLLNYHKVVIKINKDLLEETDEDEIIDAEITEE